VLACISNLVPTEKEDSGTLFFAGTTEGRELAQKEKEGDRKCLHSPGHRFKKGRPMTSFLTVNHYEYGGRRSSQEGKKRRGRFLPTMPSAKLWHRKGQGRAGKPVPTGRAGGEKRRGNCRISFSPADTQRKKRISPSSERQGHLRVRKEEVPASTLFLRPPLKRGDGGNDHACVSSVQRKVLKGKKKRGRLCFSRPGEPAEKNIELNKDKEGNPNRTSPNVRSQKRGNAAFLHGQPDD